MVKITTSYVVQTLQEMVSPDPQIIVVAPGAEPESTQVQRSEDGGTILRIFWVGPKGELLRRTPVSSVMQVGLERRFPPCSSVPGQARPRSAPSAGAPREPHLAAAAAAPRLPRGTGGRSGSGCCDSRSRACSGRWRPRAMPKPRASSLPCSSPRDSGTPRPGAAKPPASSSLWTARARRVAPGRR